ARDGVSPFDKDAETPPVPAQILPQTARRGAVWRTRTARKPSETGGRRPCLEHPAKSAEGALQNGGLYQAATIFNGLSTVSWCCNENVMQRCAGA
ncbi:hypothetical protein, partial [Pseudomonas corrugata]|uniref:hypothetical protein n=1 Tax=Pseudomonas corrugata TaxID=47879 RepID=UPI0019D6BE72